jgi:hypothetical protein
VPSSQKSLSASFIVLCSNFGRSLWYSLVRSLPIVARYLFYPRVYIRDTVRFLQLIMTISWKAKNENMHGVIRYDIALMGLRRVHGQSGRWYNYVSHVISFDIT